MNNKSHVAIDKMTKTKPFYDIRNLIVIILEFLPYLHASLLHIMYAVRARRNLTFVLMLLLCVIEALEKHR